MSVRSETSVPVWIHFGSTKLQQKLVDLPYEMASASEEPNPTGVSYTIIMC